MDVSKLVGLMMWYSVHGVIVRNPPGHYCYAVKTCKEMGDVMDYVITEQTTNMAFSDVMYQHGVTRAWIKRRDWATIGWSCPKTRSDLDLSGVTCPFLELRDKNDDRFDLSGLWSPKPPPGSRGYHVAQNWGNCTMTLDVLCDLKERAVADSDKTDSDKTDSDKTDSDKMEGDDDGYGTNVGLIAGSVIGAIVGLAVIILIALLIIVLYKLKTRTNIELLPEGDDPSPRPRPGDHRVSWVPSLAPRPHTFYRQPTKASGTYAEINDAALDFGDTPTDSGSDMTFDYQAAPGGAFRNPRKISIASNDGQIIIDFDRLKNRVDLSQGNKKRKLDVIDHIIDEVTYDDEVTLVENTTYVRPPLRRSGVVDIGQAVNEKLEKAAGRGRQGSGGDGASDVSTHDSGGGNSDDDVSLVDNIAYESAEDVSDLENADIPTADAVRKNIPTEGAVRKNMPTEGAVGENIPTEGVVRENKPTEGVEESSEHLNGGESSTDKSGEFKLPIYVVKKHNEDSSHINLGYSDSDESDVDNDVTTGVDWTNRDPDDSADLVGDIADDVDSGRRDIVHRLTKEDSVVLDPVEANPAHASDAAHKEADAPQGANSGPQSASPSNSNQGSAMNDTGNKPTTLHYSPQLSPMPMTTMRGVGTPVDLDQTESYI